MSEKRLKTIAQFRGSTESGKETFDVIQFDEVDKLYIYRRTDDYDFELTIIKRIPYNQTGFDLLIRNPEKLSDSCNLYGGWRSSLVKHPEYMPVEYYFNIKYFHEKMLRSSNNLLGELQQKAAEFIHEITSIKKIDGIREF